jgi:uncharacterized membrane protein
LLWRNSPDTENVLGLLLRPTNFNRIKKLSRFSPELRVRMPAGTTDQNYFFSEDKPMNKLLIALTAGAFALGSVAALADDKTPAAPVDQAKLKADRAAAKAAQANMTPEEKAAARKAKRAARQKELGTVEKTQQEGGEAAKTKAEEAKKAAADSKAQPKALPTAADKQKALKEQEKKASGQ